jgi:predicted transcriptional regulator
VRAYLQRNNAPAAALPALITATYDSLNRLATPPAVVPSHTAVGAVSVRKSLASPDHILSMIDGKPYRTLKKHIDHHGMTPKTYRQTYQLPDNYPMVAPSYSAERSAMAKHIGLGRKSVAAAPPTPVRRKLKIASPKAE